MKRRTFLKICGTVMASWPFSELIFSKTVRGEQADRKILIVLELMGGNDGLNTVIPFTDPEYYKLRPVIAVESDSVLKISDDLGLHPEMEGLFKVWEAGHLAMVQGVGYPDPDLSHFRSTDIWRGATMAPVIDTGWIGRYIETVYPDFPDSMPVDPAGIEMKPQNTVLMRGKSGEAGLALQDPNSMYEMIQGVILLPQTPLSETAASDELSFVRSVESQARKYSTRLYDVSSLRPNKASYPDTQLARDLSVIARFIVGGLDTSVYSVSLSGFDTHSNQFQVHPRLLRTVSDAVAAFMDDLQALGVSENVLIMTTSEFGRRVSDNGSGTDHGTASTHFLIGGSIKGGLYGKRPDLTDLDSSGNLKFTLDFRQFFAAVLTQWLGVSSENASKILQGEFDIEPLMEIF